MAEPRQTGSRVTQARVATALGGRPSLLRTAGRERAAAVRVGLVLLLVAALPVWLWHQGPPTVRLLWAAEAGLPVPTCEICRLLTLQTPPLQGPDVAEIQATLGQLGLYDGQVDGVFSPGTGAAVAVLRLKHGLSPVPRADTAFARALEAEWRTAHPAADPRETAVPVATTPPPPEGERLIVINIEQVKLTLYVDGYPYTSYVVAVGRPGSPSAVGQWRIVNKGVDVGGPFGSRWMGLSVPWGTYGIHGTNNPGSIGSHASGGCIRMFNWNVEELFEWVSVGTPVHIVSPHWVASVKPSLTKGAVGLGVVFLQWQMQRLGWNVSEADGRLGESTFNAIRDLEAFYGLEPDGIADTDVLCFLDLDR